jgi:hypothetical protein
MKYKLLFYVWLALAMPAVIFGKPPPVEKTSALKNGVILIIRHAEKPDAGDSLSAAGAARAQAYVNYFKNFTLDGQPLQLDCVFATADSASSRRPRLTLEPLAKTLGLKLDTRFNDSQFPQLAQEILSHPPGTNILICWHHGEIPQLLRALGAEPKKLLPDAKWPDDVYGWLIELRYDESGRLFESQCINENLTPADAAKPVPVARK